MPLSAAEKMRRYRDRLQQDEERLAAVREKDRKRWHERKEDGKIRLIAHKTAREQRGQRRKWRTQQRKCRQNKINLQRNLTPPSTPTAMQPVAVIPMPVVSRQKKQALKQTKRQKSKTEYELKKLRQQLQHKKRLVDMYRKRLQRATALRVSKNDTPRTKTRKFLRHATSSMIRKSLIFHHALVDQVRAKYKETHEERQKQAFSRLFTGKIITKYRLKKTVQKEIGISKKRWRTDVINANTFVRKRYHSVTARIGKRVEEFFVREDVSRMTSGKKQTLTRAKNKQQKRFLNDTVSNLHIKFLAENSDIKLSYRTFCRLKPFWVVWPKEKDRDTCQCKTHENLQFLAKKLKQEHVISTDHLDELVTCISCSVTDKACMYNECVSCKNKRFPFEQHDCNAETTWTQWKTVAEERNIKKAGGQSEIKKVTVVMKEVQSGSIYDLTTEFEEQLQRFKTHYFNIRHQFISYRQLRKQMKSNEALVHVDFSENYIAKLANAVSSYHYGASQHQISLHTGVYYVGANSFPYTFCSVSDNLEHGPPAIWAHLNPVIEHIKTMHDDVDVLHFFSDGPTSQYRQKGNFYKFCKIMAEKGFKLATWNFHESGHGKGVPDAVSAAIKRLANSIVSFGNDIPTAAEFFECVGVKSHVKLFHVSSEEIQSEIDSFTSLKLQLQSVRGTMRLHQIITKSATEFKHRHVSCFCTETRDCDCFGLTSFRIVTSHSGHAAKRAIREVNIFYNTEISWFAYFCVVFVRSLPCFDAVG